MGSHQAPLNWKAESVDLANIALDLQLVIQEERQAIYDQGLLFDWQQQPMTSELYQQQMEVIDQQRIKAFYDARKPIPILPIIRRAFDELRTSKQNPPPIVTQPTPTLLPTRQTPPAPASQLAAM